jgi:membrane protease subunit HflC
MKRSPLTIIIGALLLIIFGFLLFTFQVRQSEVAVVTTFGQPTRVVDPGPHWKWPWPIQKVHKFDKRIQNFEDKFDEALTPDNVNLLSMVYVGWRISDPVVFFPKFANDPNREPVKKAEETLEGLIRSAKSAVIGKHPLLDFLSTNEAQFVKIETEVLNLVRAQVRTNNYGIDVDFLGIKKLGLPESVTSTVFEQMQSERQVLISRTQNEGEAEAITIRSDAERKAAEMLANAEGQATRIRGEGEAEAAKSFKVFQQNPELANFLQSLTALELSLKDRATLVFDQNMPPFDLFKGGFTNLLRNINAR